MFLSGIVNGLIIWVQKKLSTKVIYIWNAAMREYMLLSEHTKEVDLYCVFMGLGSLQPKTSTRFYGLINVETTVISHIVCFIIWGQACGETQDIFPLELVIVRRTASYLMVIFIGQPMIKSTLLLTSCVLLIWTKNCLL